jgi:hypothetical protein
MAKRRTRQEWETLIAAWKSGGLSAKQFAAKHSLSKHPVRCTWSVSYRRCTADGRCTI